MLNEQESKTGELALRKATDRLSSLKPRRSRASLADVLSGNRPTAKGKALRSGLHQQNVATSSGFSQVCGTKVRALKAGSVRPREGRALQTPSEGERLRRNRPSAKPTRPDRTQ